MGASVLLSDVDVIWVQNPFPFLYRDSDAEGMSDGWDTPTTYGYDYGGGAYRIFARNSGMFFLQARRAQFWRNSCAILAQFSDVRRTPAGDE